MNHPYLFISGVCLLSFLAPELIVAAFKVQVPTSFNIAISVAGGMIAASFVL